MAQILSEVYVTFKSLFRARDMMFWVIVFPIILTVIMIGIFARGGEGVSFTVAVESSDAGWFNETIYTVLNATGAFKILTVTSGLAETVSNGTADVGLYIPEGVSANISTGTRAWIKIYYLEGVQESTTAKAYLEGVIRGIADNISMTAATIAARAVPGPFKERILFLSRPINVTEASLEPEVLATVGGARAYMAISIIGIQALYAGIFSGISLVVDRRKDRVYPILLSSPVRGWTLFASDTLSVLMIIFISSIIILGVAGAMGADYSRLEPAKTIASFLYIAVGALFMIGLGLLLSILAKTPEGATALGNIIAFPMMFLGGFTVPKFLLPPALQAVADWFPLSRVIDAVRGMAVYGYSVEASLHYAAPGIIIGLAVYAIGALVYRRILTMMAENPY
ncbi:MAG: ABC transporter permease [Desulfurococcales archaeon]|nr:ABC transporter permease [Desulfurococcales archaeon]